jgi:hypothetical protein
LQMSPSDILPLHHIGEVFDDIYLGIGRASSQVALWFSSLPTSVDHRGLKASGVHVRPTNLGLFASPCVATWRRLGTGAADIWTTIASKMKPYAHIL